LILEGGDDGDDAIVYLQVLGNFRDDGRDRCLVRQDGSAN
jgi:hypothetical protein